MGKLGDFMPPAEVFIAESEDNLIGVQVIGTMNDSWQIPIKII